MKPWTIYDRAEATNRISAFLKNTYLVIDENRPFTLMHWQRRELLLHRNTHRRAMNLVPHISTGVCSMCWHNQPMRIYALVKIEYLDSVGTWDLVLVNAQQRMMLDEHADRVFVLTDAEVLRTLTDKQIEKNLAKLATKEEVDA